MQQEWISSPLRGWRDFTRTLYPQLVRQDQSMSDVFRRILDWVGRQEVLISDHGYDALAADDILVKDILGGARAATVVEEYPTYHKGPCVLVLQKTMRASPSTFCGHPEPSGFSGCRCHGVSA